MDRYTDLETKRKLLTKLLYPVKRDGIRALRTDDIARHMDLSKATLYKYFSSKDEIIEQLIALYVDYYARSHDALHDETLSFTKRHQLAFEELLASAHYVSDLMLQDLRDTYPELLATLKVSFRQRDEHLHAFYEAGMQAGVFAALNPTLVILQDELVFRHLVNPKYLMEKNLTFRTALLDYYDSLTRQLYRPETRPTDDPQWRAHLEYLANKLSTSML